MRHITSSVSYVHCVVRYVYSCIMRNAGMQVLESLYALVDDPRRDHHVYAHARRDHDMRTRSRICTRNRRIP